LYRALAPHVRAAMLTYGGGRVAGGLLTRREVLDRFGPGASKRTASSERIDMLVTTDVLSEGVNLQDASVVVNANLSWSPARLEQRVGRLRRIGGARDSVSVYVIAPPAPAEQVLNVERRLRAKLDVAARTMGLAGTILPGLTLAPPESDAAREERIAQRLRSWHRSERADRDARVAAAVRSTREAAIACVRHANSISLLAIFPDRVTDSRAEIDDLLGSVQSEDMPLALVDVRIVSERIARWAQRHAVSDVVSLPSIKVGRTRRDLLRRVDLIASRAPRHARAQLGPMVRAARCAATAPLSAGAERVLDELARASMGDQAWLHAIGEFAALHARNSAASSSIELLALLVLRKT